MADQVSAESTSPARSNGATGDLTNVLYDVRDRIATITLNKPERLNALSHGPGSMHADIATAMRWADEDDAVHVVVVTGAGRAFCSGGDFGGGGGGTGQDTLSWVRFLEGEDADNLQIRNLTKPVVGAINGLCYGAGCIMAAHFDMLVAAESATFGLIESRMGATGIGVFPFIVGGQWAKFLMLSGELISAQKAKEIGLVLEVVPDDRLGERVEDLARRIAAMPREAVMLHKQEINGTLDMMGYAANKTYARAQEAVVNAMSHMARSSDGRLLFEVLREQGFKAFKDARDTPFKPPWLEG
jgi:enoyl-CoA hydratase/carnithine racemase